MLIVVSDAAVRKDEAAIVNALFEEGLSLFHLRKPHAAASAIQSFVEEIKQQYQSRIALHHHHALASRYNIKRLHFTEEQRSKTVEKELQALKTAGFCISTSVHTAAAASILAPCIDYVFFGPLYNSISKKGYLSHLPEGFVAPQSNAKLVAIGGIDEKNCATALQMGFSGVAVLGAVWQSNDPVNSFRQISNAYNKMLVSQ